MTLAAIGELIDELELGLDREELRAAFAIRDRLDARLAVAVGAYEAAGRHHDDGAVSMAGWLRQETTRDPKSAVKLTVTGRTLRSLPYLRQAVLDGAVSGGQLDVIVANIPLRHLDRFADHEPALVPMLAELPIDQTQRAMELWKRHADALDPGPQPTERDNQLHLAKTLPARGELRGSFDADTTALAEAALRVADPKDFDLTMPQRRAEAFATICQHFLDHQKTHTGGRHRPHLNVVISYEELCEQHGLGGGTYLDTGQPLTPTALEVLRCDSAVHRLLFSGTSGILDYGRSTRTWPADVYNAVTVRDGGCRLPGCDAPASWCDVHHVAYWERGGDTSVTNGVLLCRRHHRMVHQPGHHLKLLPDGTVEHTLPDGRIRTSGPPDLTSPTLWPEQPDGT